METKIIAEKHYTRTEIENLGFRFSTRWGYSWWLFNRNNKLTAFIGDKDSDLVFDREI